MTTRPVFTRGRRRTGAEVLEEIRRENAAAFEKASLGPTVKRTPEEMNEAYAAAMREKHEAQS